MAFSFHLTNSLQQDCFNASSYTPHPHCSVIKTPLFNKASVFISLFLYGTNSFYSFANYLEKDFCFLSLIVAHSCSYPGTRTLLSQTVPPPPITSPSLRRTTYQKGPDSFSLRTSAPGLGSERGTAGRPPSRRGVGAGLKDWADPSQMVVWLPGKKHLFQ